jgi:hypothetical protein
MLRAEMTLYIDLMQVCSATSAWGRVCKKKQELRDYIDPFESLGTKLTSGAKFEDKNAYFAFLILTLSS